MACRPGKHLVIRKSMNILKNCRRRHVQAIAGVAGRQASLAGSVRSSKLAGVAGMCTGVVDVLHEVGFMRKLELPSVGQCRCGDVQIRITAQPILTMACHCKGCQRMSASAFSLSAAIPTNGFEVTRGAPVLGGLRNPDLRHFFCPLCMSWMFTRFLPEFVNVRPTMLENVSAFEPFIETWTRAKLPWATTPARHRYPEFPPMEDYAKLTAEFSQTMS